MTQSYPHEAWCPHCQVSHAPGTKRCLHCGGRVMAARPGEDARPAAMVGSVEIAAEPGGSADDAEEEQATLRSAGPLRMGVAAIWIVLAVVGALLRSCAERG